MNLGEWGGGWLSQRVKLVITVGAGEGRRAQLRKGPVAKLRGLDLGEKEEPLKDAEQGRIKNQNRKKWYQDRIKIETACKFCPKILNSVQ